MGITMFMSSLIDFKTSFRAFCVVFLSVVSPYSLDIHTHISVHACTLFIAKDVYMNFVRTLYETISVVSLTASGKVKI